jgi:uncharacterized membrane protein YfcA
MIAESSGMKNYLRAVASIVATFVLVNFSMAGLDLALAQPAVAQAVSRQVADNANHTAVAAVAGEVAKPGAKSVATSITTSPNFSDPMTWAPPLAAMLAAGLLAGFAAGIFGIGGGFVVVPALLVVLPMLGGLHSQYAHIAIGTSAATIIVTSIRSLTSHAKRGAVEFEVLKTWAPWIVLGDGLGVLLAGHVDGRVLTLIFGSGVLLMSLNFLLPKLGDKVLSQHMPGGLMRVGIAGGLGAFSSLLGIGGGTIAIMVMTLCGRSIHKAIATASGIGTLIAIPSAIGFAFIGMKEAGLPWGSVGYVNLPAAIAVASMSMVTAPLGVAAAHSLPPAILRRSFGVYLVFIALLMLKNAMKM